MAVITSSLIVRTASVFRLVLAYFLLTNPSALTDNGLVFILTSSMRLTPPDLPATATHGTALTALILAYTGVSDLTAAALDGEAYFAHWSAQAQARLMYLFAVAAWIYTTAQPAGPAKGFKGFRREEGWGAAAKNGLVFSWAFLETLVWFMVFLTVREERKIERASRRDKRD